MAENSQPSEKLMSTYLFDQTNDKLVILDHLTPGRAYTLYLYTASNDAENSSRAATITVNGISVKTTGDPEKVLFSATTTSNSLFRPMLRARFRLSKRLHRQTVVTKWI